VIKKKSFFDLILSICLIFEVTFVFYYEKSCIIIILFQSP